MTWNAIADWPGAARGPAWAVGEPVAGGRIFTGGGDDGLGVATAACHVYNPATNSWSAIAGMAQPRTRHPWAVYRSGLIYVGGGESPLATNLSAVEVYNVVTNTWVSRASMPTAAPRPGAGLFGGTIYVFMGDVGGTKVYSYSIGSNTWATITPASVENKSDAAVTLLGDLMYVSGDTRLRTWDPVAGQFGSTYVADLASGGFATDMALTTLGTQLVMWGGSTVGSDVKVNTPSAGNTWTGLGETSPIAADTHSPASGDALYLLPPRGSTAKASYKLDVDVVGEAVHSALDDVGEFRYHPRWPELTQQWGGTDKEWDKVAQVYEYDEETGTFHGK